MSKKISLRKLLSGSKGGSILKHNKVKRALIPCLILIFLTVQFLSIQPVAAQTSPPNLNVTSNTQTLIAGVTNHVTFTIRNLGYTTANQIFVTLNMPYSSSASSTGAGVMILSGSNGVWYIDSLRYFNSSSDYYTMSVNIYVSPSAAGSTFPLSFSFTYVPAGSSTPISPPVTRTIGVIVRGSANMIILGTSTFPTTVTPGQPFSLTVDFINLGTETAESMLITPSGTGNILPTSTERIFLGDIAVDVPSSFTISYTTTNGVTSGQYNVTLGYTYKDTLGNTIPANLTVPFTLTVGAGTTTGGTRGTSVNRFGLFMMLPLLIVIVVVVVVVILYMRRRKRRAAK
jgi:hypothetical protein